MVDHNLEQDLKYAAILASVKPGGEWEPDSLADSLKRLEPFIVARMGEALPRTPLRRREIWFRRVVDALEKIER
jgi:hypothetical protein